MKSKLNFWHFAGFAFVSIAGTLLHFLYEWTNESVFIAPFSGVNESTFEHMKLLFWPMLIFAVVQCFFFRDRESFWCVKLKGTVLGLVLIPVLFYTYNGVIGKSPDWLNIAIFFVCAAIAYIYETRRFNNAATACKHPNLAFSLLCVIDALFVVFTFAVPEIGLFKDPLTGSYGI
jgi:hypothetical protein